MSQFNDPFNVQNADSFLEMSKNYFEFSSSLKKQMHTQKGLNMYGGYVKNFFMQHRSTLINVCYSGFLHAAISDVSHD